MSQVSDRIDGAPPPSPVPPPTGGRRWVQRAEGDRRAWARLELAADDGVVVLNDRRQPGTTTSIKRIAISSSGVFVLDARHFKGLVHTRRSGPISALGPDELHVGRRDCTPYLDEVAHQVEVVRTALGPLGGTRVPVHAMLCLTRAEWGFASPVEIREVCVAWPQLITRRIQEPGNLDSPTVRQVSGVLAEQLPTA